jgi:NAD(P)-dependent dehydrogenase (short-subunit alcohol dehydrogenase family)
VNESLLDRALDRSIVGGYTNLGYVLRHRHWQGDPRPRSLEGKRVLVTGAGSGLGEAAALGAARLGATVDLLGRSEDRVRPAIDRIGRTLRAEGIAARLRPVGCDVSDLADVRRFASAYVAALADGDGRLDVVVHNAGTMPAERTESAQGHELTLATHVLGPVLMTELLLPALRRSASGARVVLVASGGMYAQPLPVDDPEYSRERYRGAAAYARSKRIQVELTPLLAERWSGDGVSVHAMHPGWADTPGVASSLPLFRTLTRPLLRSPRQGADTITWLAATDPAPPSGRFWHDRTPRPTSYAGRARASAEGRRRMWAWVRDALGIADG